MPKAIEPDWETGTPLEIVWGWQIERYCILCFKLLCEYCTDPPECQCYHDHLADWGQSAA